LTGSLNVIHGRRGAGGKLGQTAKHTKQQHDLYMENVKHLQKKVAKATTKDSTRHEDKKWLKTSVTFQNN